MNFPIEVKRTETIAYIAEVYPPTLADSLAAVISLPPDTGAPGTDSVLTWHHDEIGKKGGSATFFVPTGARPVIDSLAPLVTLVAEGSYRDVRGRWYAFRPSTSQVEPPYFAATGGKNTISAR